MLSTRRSIETGLEAVMAGTITVETLAQALAQFETIGMPARNLAVRTRREYSRDLREVLSYLEQGGTTQLSGTVVQVPKKRALPRFW